jgi:4-hydroxy-tetrahydrodipicolinate reductase
MNQMMNLPMMALAEVPQRQLKVGLVGFGKTGRSVATVLLQSPTVELHWVLRRSSTTDQRSAGEFLDVSTTDPGIIFSAEGLPAEVLLAQDPVDVIVDFSSPEGIHYYGEEAARRGIAIVTAVSQYPAETLALLRNLANRTRVVRSPNITLGINFLLIAARILKNIAPETHIEIVEEHFKAKPEVSGTAKIIARHLDVPDDAIKSIRAGGIIGTHEIIFGFPYQNVRLKHESISREAFGNGVLFALDNLPDAPAGMFGMEDLLIPYFRLQSPESEFTASKKKPWWKIW